MAWTDKPTDKQLNAVYRFLAWNAGVPDIKAKDATDWLEENADRKQVSDELTRLRDLCIDKELKLNNCFSSEIWESYEFDNERLKGQL